MIYSGGYDCLSFQIFWQPPVSSCPILYHDISYKTITSTDWDMVSVYGTSVSIIASEIKNIQPATTYQVRVRAVSDVGNGEWSAVVLENTVNGNPRKILVANHTHMHTSN